MSCLHAIPADGSQFTVEVNGLRIRVEKVEDRKVVWALLEKQPPAPPEEEPKKDDRRRDHHDKDAHDEPPAALPQNAGPGED